MTMHDTFLPVRVRLAGVSRLPLSLGISALSAAIADWLATAVAYWGAAAMYEQRFKLQPWGPSRAQVARDLCEACQPTGR